MTTTVTTETPSRPNFKQYLAKKNELNALKASAVRCLPMWLWHVVLPPVSSLVYCNKMGYWKPAIAATALFAVTFPIDLAGTVVISSIAPPVLSAAMITSKVKKSREQLGIVMPEEADATLYDRGLM